MPALFRFAENSIVNSLILWRPLVRIISESLVIRVSMEIVPRYQTGDAARLNRQVHVSTIPDNDVRTVQLLEQNARFPEDDTGTIMWTVINYRAIINAAIVPLRGLSIPVPVATGRVIKRSLTVYATTVENAINGPVSRPAVLAKFNRINIPRRRRFIVTARRQTLAIFTDAQLFFRSCIPEIRSAGHPSRPPASILRRVRLSSDGILSPIIFLPPELCVLSISAWV